MLSRSASVLKKEKSLDDNLSARLPFISAKAKSTLSLSLILSPPTFSNVKRFFVKSSLILTFLVFLRLRLQLHGAIYRPDSFVMMLRYCANLKAIRHESTSSNKIVADKSHRVIVA